MSKKSVTTPTPVGSIIKCIDSSDYTNYWRDQSIHGLVPGTKAAPVIRKGLTNV